MAIPLPDPRMPLPMPTSGCQLLPGLCISVHDEHFAQSAGGLYRVRLHGEQVLDVVLAHLVGWDLAQDADPLTAVDDAMLADTSPQANVASLHARVRAAGMPSSAQLCVLYLRIDMAQRQVCWVGCGAPSPIVFKASGESHCVGSLQPPLGHAAVAINQDSFAWEAGDALFLGLASGGAQEAQALAKAMAQQRQLHNTPAMALHGLRASWPQAAGAFLLLLQHHARGVALDRLELPVSLDSLAPLRDFVGLHAQRANLSEDQEAGFVLAAVEVATNVVRHARGLMAQAPMEILVEHLAQSLVLYLRYFGEAYQPASVAQSHDLSTYPEGGFGQFIIQQVCDQVRYDHHAGVNLVQLTVSSRR